MKLYKYTEQRHLEDGLFRGVFAANINTVNDPYECEGIKFSDDYRIVCLTKSYKSMLMWSYYNQHKGCVIAYDTSSLIENQIIKDVQYSKKLLEKSLLNSEDILNSLYSKGKEWKHEKECRAVYYRPDFDTKYWITSNDGKVFLKAIPTEVIFGVKAETDDSYHDSLQIIEKYQNYCSKITLPMLDITKLKVSSQKYMLVFDNQYDYKRELQQL